MRCRRIPFEADVEQYRPGMEDGFALFSDVVTKSWFVTDNLIRVRTEDGRIVTPYILGRRGRTFICEGDYIITDQDGTKHCCGADKIFDRYERID